MDRFNEFYLLQSKAKEQEKTGRIDSALNTYIDIVTNYQPNNDFSYDRVTTLLEKKARFNEAYDLCNKAIDLIQSKDIDGDVSKFEKKIARIKSKLDESPSPKKQKAKETFHFYFPGFRSHNKVYMALAALYYTLTLFVSLPNHYFRYLVAVTLVFMLSYGFDIVIKLMKKERTLITAIVFFISLTLFSFGVYNLPEVNRELNIELSGDSSTEDGESTTSAGHQTDEDLETDGETPEIPESYIDHTIRTTNNNHEVENSFVWVEGQTVRFDIIVKPATSIERSKKISLESVKSLSSQMVPDGLKPPLGTYLGELYDHYTLSITVSTEFDANFLTGSKSISQEEITWKERD